MGKKFFLCLLAVWLSFALSGCSFAVFDAKNLMAPPKTNEDQQAIHKLLQGSQQDISFVYPKTGEFRSAIIMQDFTGDGRDDAIGFYSLADSGGVAVQFLVKTEGKWRTAATFQNTALQVDRVCLGDLTGSGVNSVLIGWGSAVGTTGRTALVNAYICDDSGSIEEYPLGLYGEMALSDLDGDGICEVFTVDKFLAAEKEGEEPTPAKARVYAWQDGSMTEICSADADNSISSYSQAVFGKLAPALQGVVLDGAKADGSMTTQVFYLQDGALVNFPAGVNTEGYSNPFSRPSTAPFLSRDINGDGYLEMPLVSPLPCPLEEAPLDSTSYQVKWQTVLQSMENRTAVRALMNSAEGYWFRLPYQLEGKIAASNDTARRTVTYTGVMESTETGEKLLGFPLFAIRVFTRSAWESRGQSSGYERLDSQNDLVYGIQTMTKDEDALRYIEGIKKDFHLLED